MTERLSSFAESFPLEPTPSESDSDEFKRLLRDLFRLVGYDDAFLYEDVTVSYDELDIETYHDEYASPFTCPLVVGSDPQEPHIAAMGYVPETTKKIGLGEYAPFREAVTVLYDMLKPNLTVALTPETVWVRSGPQFVNFPLAAYDPERGKELRRILEPPEQLAV